MGVMSRLDILMIRMNRFPDTDMGNASARKVGLERAFQTVEESVGGIVKLIDGATRESAGAQLRVWDGTVFPW